MKRALITLFGLALAACGDSQFAAYLIDGGQHSLTLTRQQAYVGGDWDSVLVVARMPDCQRRYPLPGVIDDKTKMDVYRSEPGVFILNSGKRWYVTETRTCRFDQFKEPPAAPGDLVGSFQVAGGTLAFKNAAARAPTPAQ